MEEDMLSNRPYLLRAFYQWIVDSECTPYMVISAQHNGVVVPDQFIDNGKIVLNVSPRATRDFSIENDAISFRARFSGVERHITAPVDAILAIYAVENGRGIVFDENDIVHEKAHDHPPATIPPAEKSTSTKKSAKSSNKKRGHLRLIE